MISLNPIFCIALLTIYTQTETWDNMKKKLWDEPDSKGSLDCEIINHYSFTRLPIKSQKSTIKSNRTRCFEHIVNKCHGISTWKSLRFSAVHRYKSIQTYEMFWKGNKYLYHIYSIMQMLQKSSGLSAAKCLIHCKGPGKLLLQSLDMNQVGSIIKDLDHS